MVVVALLTEVVEWSGGGRVVAPRRCHPPHCRCRPPHHCHHCHCLVIVDAVVGGSGVRSEGAIGQCLVSRDTIRTHAHMYSVDRNNILESLEWHCSNVVTR